MLSSHIFTTHVIAIAAAFAVVPYWCEACGLQKSYADELWGDVASPSSLAAI